MKKKKKIITYGTYDMLHIGHINIMSRAKARGDYLIVGVTSDDYDRSRGKLNVVQSEDERVAAVQALDFVDEVVLETHKHQKQEDVVRFHIDEFVIGDDWVGKFDYLKEWTNVIYLPRTKGISSTQLRNDSIKPLKLGLIGARRDAKRFLEELKFVDFIEAEYIFDQNQQKAKELSDEFNIQETTDNLEEILSSSVDAVYISGHNLDDYTLLIQQSLEQGKHVLCENPLSIKQKEVKLLFKLAKKKNKLLLVALKTAFTPAFNKLLEELQNNPIGDILEVRATFTSLYEEKGFSKKYLQYGATNLLLHYPALLIHKLAGKPKKTLFIDQFQDKKYDISNRIITKHKNEVIGISTVGIGMKSDGSAFIGGTKGYVYIPAPWWLTKEFYFKFEDASKEYKFEYEFEGDGLRYMISEFASLIRQNKIESKRLTIKDMISLNKLLTQYNKTKKGK
jgi:glycerol-3-phosphate cytidylyltransferase